MEIAAEMRSLALDHRVVDGVEGSPISGKSAGRNQRF